MRDFRQRLRKLETLQRQRPPTHFVSVVNIPPHIEHDQWHEYLTAEVTCPGCGRRACPELKVGSVTVAPCETGEEWAERVTTTLQKSEAEKAGERSRWFEAHHGAYGTADGAA
jgi:hypothetical protein